MITWITVCVCFMLSWFIMVTLSHTSIWVCMEGKKKKSTASHRLAIFKHKTDFLECLFANIRLVVYIHRNWCLKSGLVSTKTGRYANDLMCEMILHVLSPNLHIAHPNLSPKLHIPHPDLSSNLHIHICLLIYTFHIQICLLIYTFHICLLTYTFHIQFCLLIYTFHIQICLLIYTFHIHICLLIYTFHIHICLLIYTFHIHICLLIYTFHIHICLLIYTFHMQICTKPRLTAVNSVCIFQVKLTAFCTSV